MPRLSITQARQLWGDAIAKEDWQGSTLEKVMFDWEKHKQIGQISASGPAVMRPLERLNTDQPYSRQIKPFNFLISCHLKKLGYPPDVDAERFHLIAPYERDSRQWLKMDWIDQYSGKSYRISTASTPTRRTARVKTYGEVISDYEVHPEAKCADSQGEPCKKQTVGLLQRRHVQVDEMKFIGKESNSLEEVEAGLVHSGQNVYTDYPNPKRDEWSSKIVPVLNQIFLSVQMAETGISRRELIDYRKGRRRPHLNNLSKIRVMLRKLGKL